MHATPPQAVVIFGASGDLTRRKLLPAFYHLFVEGMLPEDFAIVGYSRTPFTDGSFREHARDAVAEFGRHRPEGDTWERFASLLSYVTGEFSSEGAFDRLVERLERTDRDHGTGGRRLLYAATPPAAYTQIVDRVAEAGIAEGSRVVFEKPFGRDAASARELNDAIHRVFDESQVFRIDHYMGKETVQNILALRFGNGMFEPIWNRRYVDHVQITVAEDIGIEGRGAFYEQTGALRDMVQTHLLQMMTFVAMEPPVSFDPDRLREEKVKVLHATMACERSRAVLGQYVGYGNEEGVARDSMVETFAALELHVDSWRWAGVPFYLRTGKRLERKTSEVTLVFRDVPYDVFRGTGAPPPKRDHLTLRIQPDEGITLALNAKEPGHDMRLGRITMDFDYDLEFTSPLLDAYELLMVDAMAGDPTLFLSEQGVERAWDVLAPVLDDPPPAIPYAAGTWGPDEADALVDPHRWHVHAKHA